MPTTTVALRLCVIPATSPTPSETRKKATYSAAPYPSLSRFDRADRHNRRVNGGSTGVIGVGNMGLAMAGRLREQGRAVLVRDLRADREAMAERDGARACSTPAVLSRHCEVVIVAVVDAAQTEAVLFGNDGVAAAAAPGTCVILCPTIAPESVESFATRLDALGIDWIEAPMSGGPARARAGTMSLMVACRDAVFDRRAALLATLADPVFRLGDRAGDGARTKLVNNLLAAVNLVGAAEALALADDSPYGLAACIYGGGAAEVAALARSHGQVFEGEIWIDYYARLLHAPYGGRKRSGWVWETVEGRFAHRDGSRANAVEFSRPVEA